MATAIQPMPEANKDTRALPETMPLVRVLVRDILTASPSYHRLNPHRKRELAAAMVRVCHAGASYLRDEHENRSRVKSAEPAATSSVLAAPQSGSRRRRPTFAMAQSAGSDFSGVSAQKVAGTTQAILNAVSFPRFVTELINGVFKAMISSSTQQMNAYVELLNNVSASLSGFSETSLSDQTARQWIVDKFPGSYQISAPGDSGEDGPVLVQKDDGKLPSEEALKTAFGLGPSDSVPSGDPETALLPFAKIQIARQRQQMLSTMVMLGMQRIVVDSGKINAAMHFHIDTRSAAQDDQGSTFSEQNQIDASASFGIGAWGASAKVSNTIGYVSTQRSQTTEEMNTDLDLSSSVEINFRSDYLPLNRMTTPDQASRIRANTINPEAETAAAEKARAAANSDLDKARWADLSNTLQPKGSQAPSAAASPGANAAKQNAPAPAKTAVGNAQAPAANDPKTPGAITAKPATPNTPAPAAGNNTPSPTRNTFGGS